MEEIVSNNRNENKQELTIPTNFLIHDLRGLSMAKKIDRIRENKNGKVKESKLTDVDIADLMV